jgi:Tol biopolymer transport system component
MHFVTVPRSIALSALLFTGRGLAAAQQTERMSVDAAGTEGNGGSGSGVAISRDGRFVAFASVATNLVAGDVDTELDLFVRDRLTATIECVSVDPTGAMVDGLSIFPALSADGRFVAFESFSSTLVPGDTNHRSDVFVRDLSIGATERVSVDSSGAEQNGISLPLWYAHVSISADGTVVAFSSSATNLVTSDTNGCDDVFVHDRLTGVTERASISSSGAEGDGASYRPSLSADGRFVAFESQAQNLVAGLAGGILDVFVHDRQTGTTECVSIDPAGAVGNFNAEPSLSADGRFVAFMSTGALTAGDGNDLVDVYVRDRQAATTELVSVDSSGLQGDRDSVSGSISADGRSVAFISGADDLVANDRNGVADVFVRDRTLGTTARVSVATSGAEANDEARLPFASPAAISGDGRCVVFDSDASNLVAGDSNGVTDVFVRGPWLTLEADPPQAATGATLTFTTWTGGASDPALLALIDTDGVPMFVLVSLSTFDGNGVWSFAATVPPGLSGSVLMLQTYGFVPTGKAQASNEVAVTFQ